ncbi:Predicted 5' DNA nuclease, flap endonuclease-1-like, helix-3-turn-helix (H3TH) domain [Aquimarina amphilecti]|uniref:Predicted 5' DNA nuclease, flap endonuclease-1-like, helix-3-turn-helix (H3TH) domain n=1 Tax=Aquimarina amphilecti TaxID=1038014 RepID=A0A1H7G910_AQUAM|nr:hypothetical protein [Aquimarina amphilecti]SEK34618.1 Predicted 5' DNA nuclease, flap endonuclease-1-like, helix-3-turn-helix (H3TH) domain [Aquimarina amphilecti]
MLDFLNEANWWCLLLLLLIAFLLGWLLSRWSLKNKYQDKLDQCYREKEKLRKASDNYKKANTTFSNPIPVETPKSIEVAEIKKDVGNDEKPQLNFESFGTASESQKDDLKLISGVGPFIEKKLNSIGIYTFDQISKFTKEDIETVTELIQFFPGRIERDNWTTQAEKLKNQ